MVTDANKVFYLGPPLIPKIEQDIVLHPDTLEIVPEAQFLSVVQNLHWLIKYEKLSWLDHLPFKDNLSMDLVVRICFREEQLYHSSCFESMAISCKEKNIFYRQLLLSSKRLDHALKYLNMKDTYLEQWKRWDYPMFMGCYRSYWSCQLLSEIEKWQHFEKNVEMT